MNKIIDCFTFFNELDLLEIRLKYLSKEVDYFVIVESDTTFNGERKNLNLQDNMQRFKDFEDKIIYVPLRMKDFPNKANIAWEREKYQRNYIKKGLDQIDLKDEDLVLISDIDEIPNIEVLRNIKNNKFKNLNIDKKSTFFLSINLIVSFLKSIIYISNKTKKKKHLLRLTFLYSILIKNYSPPISFKMLFCYYYINYRKKEELWSGLQCVNAKWLQTISIQEIRDLRNFSTMSIINGWHFSYLGGIKKIQYKIKNFSHQEYNVQEILSDSNIKFCIENGYGLFDYFNNPKNTERKFFRIDVNDFPTDFKEIIVKYKHLIV